MRAPLVSLAVVLVVFTSAADVTAKELKGDGPTSIAAGFGSVWIGFGSGDIVRLDASSGRRQARFTGTGFVHGVAAAAGAIWVVGAAVTRVDPVTGGIRDVPGSAASDPIELAAAAGDLWAVDAGSNEILRVDPGGPKIAPRIRVPGRAWGVAAAGSEVLVLSVPHGGPVTGRPEAGSCSDSIHGASVSRRHAPASTVTPVWPSVSAPSGRLTPAVAR
jgi:hypothetical protein